jgi:hypothetical protein
MLIIRTWYNFRCHCKVFCLLVRRTTDRHITNEHLFFRLKDQFFSVSLTYDAFLLLKVHICITVYQFKLFYSMSMPMSVSMSM